MESSQTEARHENKSTVKYEEARLILHDVVAPTAGHLCDSIFSRQLM